MIYMDYQATTPLEKEVLETITQSLEQEWANPSSCYPVGLKAKASIKVAREWVAKMINAKDSNIIFTSGGTESNNMVLQSAIKYFNASLEICKNNLKEAGVLPHIITSNVEHDSIKKVLEHLQLVQAAEVTFVAVSQKTGHVEVEDVIAAVKPNTCLISIMMANNETGILNPLAEICQAVKSLKRNPEAELCDILMHTDAGQAVGKVTVDVQTLGVDYLTIVGHKFYGPRIGAVFTSDSAPSLYPMFFGGGQENDIRPGTENTAMIAGLGKACQLVCENLHAYAQHMQEVRDYLERKHQSEFFDIHINGSFRDGIRIPNVLNVSFCGSGMLGHEILSRCKVLQASVGAACHSEQFNKPSPILLAIGIDEKTASSAIRLSVGRSTTKQDVDLIIADLLEATCQ